MMRSRILKNILPLLLCATALLFIPACGAKNEAGTSVQSIVGTWKYSLNEEYRDIITEVIQDPAVYDDIFYVFNDDGTGSTYTALNSTPVSFSYTYDGESLTMDMGGSEFSVKCTVNGNNMTIVEGTDEAVFKRQ